MRMAKTTVRSLCGVAVVAAIIGLAVYLRLSPQEPTYEGKTVDEWMILSLKHHPHRNEKAIAALRQMGEPAVQHLGWMLEHEDSAFKLKLLSLSEKYPWIEKHVSSTYWYRL